jgi:hypothetical protein
MTSLRKVLLTGWCLVLCSLAPAQTPAANRTRESVTRDMDEVARIASVMVDGDRCGRIMTARAIDSIVVGNPRDRYAASDNFDVNHENYIEVKKTLIRLSRVVPYPCDVNLWMPIPGQAGKIQILIRNANEWSQFWSWGRLTQDVDPEMKRVLETGRRETVTAKAPYISVLAPVTNSLGDVVGLVEAVTIDPAAVPPTVHARNPLKRQPLAAGLRH